MSETPRSEFDLAVLGSGGAALAAAIRATGLGRLSAAWEAAPTSAPANTQSEQEEVQT